MISKLYAGLLIIASLFAMVALGVVILIVITDVSHLAVLTNGPAGMIP
jgi:hypothetical protein